MARKKSRFLVQQQIALGAFGVIALGIVAYLSWIAITDTTTETVTDGDHYQVLDNPRRIGEGRVSDRVFQLRLHPLQEFRPAHP